MSARVVPLRLISLNGQVVVELWPDSARLRFVNGAELTSAPENTSEYRALAKTLGYGECEDATLHLCWEHDFLHCWLALYLGASTIAHTVPWHLAHKTMHTLSGWTLDGQEALTLAFQRYLHTGYAGHELAIFSLLGLSLEQAAFEFGQIFGATAAILSMVLQSALRHRRGRILVV